MYRAGKYLLIIQPTNPYTETNFSGLSHPQIFFYDNVFRLYSLQSSAPGDPPIEITAMATSPVSIIIQWGRVPCINRNSNITGYTVHYSRGGGSTVSVSVSGTDQSERTYTATLLVPSTNYSIQVAAVTSTGVTGPFSTTVTETTSPPRSESVQ